MYFVKVTFIDGTEEVHKIGDIELPRELRNDKIEGTTRILMYVLSFLSKRKIQPIILKLEFIDPPQ